MAVLDAAEKKLLVQAEKDWVRFRDSHCNFEIEQYEGGSISPLIYANCLTELTQQRIEALKASLEDHDK